MLVTETQLLLENVVALFTWQRAISIGYRQLVAGSGDRLTAEHVLLHASR